MSTDPISSGAAPQSVTTLNTGAATEAHDSTLTDYDDFLTLLTTELKNQDPLNPQDSSEWIAQLANFSSVEQQINMNTKLDELIALSSADSVSELASWLGHSVSAPGVALAFDGDELSIPFPSDPQAEEARIHVMDASGAVVATLPASAAGGEVVWDGATDDGGQAPAGAYSVEFHYSRQTDDGPESWSVRPEVYADVLEARQGETGTELVLSTGDIVRADDVTGVSRSSDTLSDDGESSSGGFLGAVEDAAEAVVDAVT